jgi:hypothetical protein
MRFVLLNLLFSSKRQLFVFRHFSFCHSICLSLFDLRLLITDYAVDFTLTLNLTLINMAGAQYESGTDYCF